ncbi:hypothetical protein BDV96DRAFT_589756 [Lophiotrema nucula]|uniref:Ubiquitin 3 binding protein But2 C-terminal domain-containing protein n=1 Tax=Lophiotrema nucula TaxID=690887 RepID=A0A6A5YLC9_9PLEO|nr:hypothetical protein BDV96DRAFT_589756 [Lophiotrema nucula]
MRLSIILANLSGLVGTSLAAVVEARCPNTTVTPTPTPTGYMSCQTVYPNSIRQIYSYYPNMTSDARDYNMLVRSPDFEIATEFQFLNIPKAGYACQLELIVPDTRFLVAQGNSRIINVYQVKAAPSSVPSWQTYAGNKSGPGIWGSIDASDNNLQSVTERGGGKILINTAACNETLTFQVGFAAPGSPETNYWGFPNIVPPANPAMGWRIVHSCT